MVLAYRHKSRVPSLIIGVSELFLQARRGIALKTVGRLRGTRIPVRKGIVVPAVLSAFPFSATPVRRLYLYPLCSFGLILTILFAPIAYFLKLQAREKPVQYDPTTK